MGTLIMPIGISACGKSAYGKKIQIKNNKIKIVCPDEVRKSFGDISDQSNNIEVFNIVNHQLEDYLFHNETVYYDATNLSERSRKTPLNLAMKYNSKLIVIIFLTSYRYDICEDRCRKDLSNGIERSNTLSKDEKGNTIIHNQNLRFCKQMKEIEKLKIELKTACSDYKIIFKECERV